jgi:alanine racemase
MIDGINKFMKLIARFLRVWLRRLRKARFFYTPLIELRISREALLHNLHSFQKLSLKAVAPVLKSNAYGHGLVAVATILKNESMPFLCVDSFFEVLILRNEGLTKPILILGKTILENIIKNNLPNVAFSIISLEDVQELVKVVKKETVLHIELDTGLHRHGVNEAELKQIIELLKTNPHIRIEGIYTHLADADTPNSRHLEKQIAWEQVS